tara:strand:+ start:283 stop:507 length:225 start_codon:yes stop_codon:yes gene_type:complete
VITAIKNMKILIAEMIILYMLVVIDFVENLIAGLFTFNNKKRKRRKKMYGMKKKGKGSMGKGSSMKKKKKKGKK